MSDMKHTPGKWSHHQEATRLDGGPGYDLWPSNYVVIGDRKLELGNGLIAEANARLVVAAPVLLDACQEQHKAIDILFAMLIEAKPGFFPTKSGQPWEALQKGNAAIAKGKVP